MRKGLDMHWWCWNTETIPEWTTITPVWALFTWPNLLQQHLLTHTRKKPHQCDYCQKRFITPSNLYSCIFTVSVYYLIVCFGVQISIEKSFLDICWKRSTCPLVAEKKEVGEERWVIRGPVDVATWAEKRCISIKVKRGTVTPTCILMQRHASRIEHHSEREGI